MGFWQRLFSSEYRRALAAEAAGDYLAAARSYALCGESQKVCDMHLAQSRRQSGVEGRIESLRNALGFAAGERRMLVLRLLADALKRAGERQGGSTREGRQCLVEAGELFAEGHSYEAAAECFLAAGAVSAAVDAYSRAGQLEKVEGLLAQQEQRTERDRELHNSFDDYQLHMSGGQRDEALERLRACVQVAQRKGEYRRLLADLEERLLRGNAVELEHDGHRLLVVGGAELLAGRDAACQLVVRGPSVSRRHVAIHFEDDSGEFFVADAGSRNGTLLDGLKVGGRLPLPPGAIIGLGDRAELRIERLSAAAPTLHIEVAGTSRDSGRRALFTPRGAAHLHQAAPPFPAASVTFRRGRPLLAAAEGTRLRLNGEPTVGAIQLIVGDEVDVDDRRITVVR